MALGPSDIQYFDVDSSGSASLPRSKRYQLMHVPVAEDVTDPERSDYRFRHRPGGVELWGVPERSPSVQTPIRPTRFSTIGFSRSLCAPTHSRCASCRPGGAGMRFLDPARLNRAGSCFRTPRGVEKADEWDPVRKRSYVKLIREVP
jgi:hypothetical protein